MSVVDVQAGCFRNLLSFSFRKKRSEREKNDVPTKSARRPTELPVVQVPEAKLEESERPGLSVKEGELPPYANAGFFCAHSNAQAYADLVKPPAYSSCELGEYFRPEVLETIEDTLEKLNPALRELSLDILHHPEIQWEEKRTHDTLTAFMSSHGFAVTQHYLDLPTAWRAEFTHTSSSNADAKLRVIGVNSEMDALPGIGHACGHNLIAIAGVGVALAIKAALEKHNVPGKVVLLGTPAEEGGGGKINLLDGGAYEEMDACLMCHPSPGPPNYVSIGPSLACQPLEIEFFGHGAHAAWAPWEAQNALDAAFLAYSSVSVLRQQIKPTHRVHGIVSGKDWAPNVIPDYAKMHWIVRAPTWAELVALRERVKACFEAAAHATGCKLTLKAGPGYYDLRQNTPLGEEFAKVVKDFGVNAQFDEGMAASTDFGNVTYALPSLHPCHTIPTKPNGANHTPQFTEAAGTPEAHAKTITVMKGLAATGFRILADGEFTAQVKKAWEEQMIE
ncbi:hypothetical protein POSPLADRAFT_1180127 [Postia placenta MAD-698-R-SB12]|uniref:Peptidase M20 dimerisation domain-containing protein n=1 Tax=Postia placenta MAD-698-R-SB12 TaxID=670580 RepID=A0A1X6N799_9APHY|nr:hypothetical protein POSPLADRAFT_1180127 [Postia placenta MAD-698-R-SB12]OSX64497.1 hypothetical protein POSPLADRAFT_1180127 [Postia placenta MAD-698-R-SB12]